MIYFRFLVLALLFLTGCQNSMGQYTGFQLPPGCAADIVFGAGLGGALAGHIKCAAAPFVQSTPVAAVKIPTPASTELTPTIVYPVSGPLR